MTRRRAGCDARSARVLLTIRYRQRTPAPSDEELAQRRFDLAVARELVDDCC